MIKLLIRIIAIAMTIAVVSITAPTVFAYYSIDPNFAQNGYLQISVSSPETSVWPGRFTIGTTGGDPGNPNDDNRALLHSHPYPRYSYSTIQLDGENIIFGDTTRGTMGMTPQGYVTYNNSVFIPEDSGVRIEQRVSLIFNPSTGLVDLAEIRYTLSNTGREIWNGYNTDPHDLGLRILLDTTIGNPDEMSFQVPGAGFITTEHEFAGEDVPDNWSVMDDQYSPTITAEGILKGGETTTPDRAVFASMPEIYDSTWDYEIDSTKTFGTDTQGHGAVALYWDPQRLEYGDRVEYVIYYGLSGRSESYSGPLALTVDSPLNLSVLDDQYDPNPFTVTANLVNQTPHIAYPVSATINLPPGLSLDESEAIRDLGTLGPYASRSVSWEVTAPELTDPTWYSYTISYYADVEHTSGPEERTLSRSVLVPGLSLSYDTGFQANPDGYQFANFGASLGDSPPFGWPLFTAVYGYEETQLADQHRPRAQAFYDAAFVSAARSGSCFGMAASSLVLYQNEHPGWDIANPLDSTKISQGALQNWGVIPSEVKYVKQWVEYYHVRQFDAACQSDIIAGQHAFPTPRDAYNALKQRMARGDWIENPYVITIWGIGWGHAIVPVGIIEAADHHSAQVIVYDNNYPGQQTSIQFDLVNNTATYGGPLQSVQVVDLSAVQMEPDMVDYEAVTPNGHLLYTDPEGKHLGYYNGQFESEIEGAYKVRFLEQGGASQPELYYIGDLNLKRELIGTESGIASVSIMLPTGVANIKADIVPGSLDEITILDGGKAVDFLSHQGSQSVSISLALENAAFARVFTLDGFGVEAGSSVRAEFTSDLGSVLFTNRGIDKTFNLHLENIDIETKTFDSIIPLQALRDQPQIFQFAVFTSPLAADDTATTPEDQAVTMAVLDNDTNPGSDPVQVFILSQHVNGSLELNPDNTITYTPDDDYNGTDNFTYRFHNGQAYSNIATATITVTPVNDAPTGYASPTPQTVQYSDGIADVTIDADDIDSPGSALHVESMSYSKDAESPVNDLPAGLSISAPNVITEGPPSEVHWTVSGNIQEPAGTYVVTVEISDGEDEYSVKFTINVAHEDATGELQGDEVAFKTAPGATYPSLSLTVWVKEAYSSQDGEPDGDSTAPGNIGFATAGIPRLVPITGSSISGTATRGTASVSNPYSYGDYKPFTLTFTNIPVNTYTLELNITGDFYFGKYETVIVIYDPTLGFAAGGGWFYMPGTAIGDYPGDKTNFGFTMKYNKKGQNVQGSLLLIQHLSDGVTLYRIKSNALYGLALSPADSPIGYASFSGKCTYIGPETWPDNVGGQEFMAYVEDVQEPGRHFDRFWFTVLGMDLTLDADQNKVAETGECVVIEGGNISVPHTPGGTLKFDTGITSDFVPLPGTLSTEFTITTTGEAGTMHELGLTGTKSTPTLADGQYPFILRATSAQKTDLIAYFAAKTWPDASWYTQINAEINGTSPFFYLNAAGGVYTLVDNFKATLGPSWPAFITSTTLTIDDDYPPGAYKYTGTIKGMNGGTLPITVTLKVVRAP